MRYLHKLLISILFIATFGYGTTINVPADSSTIELGINGASDGDTVLVAAGTYIENINYNGKNIVVGSLFLTTSDTSYISSTIIDGNQNGSVVTFENGEDTTAVFSGFTIQNGDGQGYGGGIFANQTDPTINSCIIKNNTANGGGAGAFFQNSNTSIINCDFLSNVTNDGAAGGIMITDYSNINLRT